MSPIDDELGLSLDRMVRHYKATETVEVPDMSKNYGWDGSAWRKLPLVFGWSGTYGEVDYDTAMPAGDQSLSLGQVPAGEIWVVTGASLWVKSASCTTMRLMAVVSGTTLDLAENHGPTTDVVYHHNIHVVLEEDDRMIGKWYDLTLNDDAAVQCWGYKMLIAE